VINVPNYITALPGQFSWYLGGISLYLYPQKKQE